MRDLHQRPLTALSFSFCTLLGPGLAGAADTEPGIPTDDEATIVVHTTRLENPLVGASTTIIEAEQLERAPIQNLPDFLGWQAGLNRRDIFGDPFGSQAAIDIRGFGETGTQNSLILVNGRRLNDLDLSAVDWASIPRDNVERVEITRGNGGAVLYGDGAVGGVINIITKRAPDEGWQLHEEVRIGTHDYIEGSVSAGYGAEEWTWYGHVNAGHSDGYRENNDTDQRNVFTEGTWQYSTGYAYANVSWDDQKQRFPGNRLVNPVTGVDQFADDRRGSTTPNDYAETTGWRAALGTVTDIHDDIELIADLSYRRKESEAFFDDYVSSFFSFFSDTRLDNIALTPRVTFAHALGSMPMRTVTGIDLSFTDYEQERRQTETADPTHIYEGDQTNIAAYAQSTIALSEDIDATLGLRIQNNSFEATDTFDPLAPTAFGTEAPAYDEDETEYAFNLGAEWRCHEEVAIFAHLARSFRLPTIDERLGTLAGDFQLENQTSIEGEIGIRYDQDLVSITSSVYHMQLEDELAYDPTIGFFGANTNLEDTQRTGWENSLLARPVEQVEVTASFTLQKSEFRNGAVDGNTVPLVPDVTGSLGALWQATDWLYLAANLNYVGEMYKGNDFTNDFEEVPNYTVVDLRVGGQVEQLHWGLQVNNLFDEEYYNSAFISGSTPGAFGAFPLPERTFVATAALDF